MDFDTGPEKVGVVDATEHVLRRYVDDQLVQTMPTSLGSHGCLDVSTADAGWSYANPGRGDVVEVSDAGPRLAGSDGFGDWDVSWDEWVAGSALHPGV